MKNLTTFSRKSSIKTVFCYFFYTTAYSLKDQNLPKHPKNTLKSPISTLSNLAKNSPQQPKTPISPAWQILCQIAKLPQERFLWT